jgi:hypothetical protein
MAGILPKTANRVCRQIFDSATTPRFDEPQVRPVPRTAPYFIPSAMTGFITSVFLYPNRVSLKEAFAVLEPDDGL